MKKNVAGAPAVSSLFILVVAFTIISGGLALAYEVVWMRLLALVAGHGPGATCIVAAAFMGGLALGSLLAERPAARRLPPLVLYGSLELGIALYALLFPWLLALVEPLANQAYRIAGASPHLATALELGWASVLLLVPTTLMGATIPAVVRLRVAGLVGPGRLAWLYGANSLGGSLGALAVTFLALPALGHRTTLLVLAGTGVVLGAAAILVGRRAPAAREIEEQPVLVGPEALCVAGITGLCGMALEMAWTRACVLFVGSSTYAFSIILATFIAGLAAGSQFAAIYLDRLGGRRRVVACLLVVLGVAGLSSLVTIGQIPVWVATRLAGASADFSQARLVELILVTLVTLPVTVCLGALLPLAASLPGTLASTGHLYAVNTVGAVLGTLLSTFVWIPVGGLAGTIGAASLAPLVLGGFLLVGSPATAATGRRSRPARSLPTAPPATVRQAIRSPRLAFAAALAVTGLTVLWLLPPWDLVLINAGPFHNATNFRNQAARKGTRLEDEIRGAGQILFHREGPAATVAVRESGNRLRTLLVNGKPDASTLLDMKTQRLVAHLPLALVPDARDVLVVGLGSGVSAGAVLKHPIVRSTVVELCPEVVEASRYFVPESNAPLDDPRTRLIVGDARTHLFRTSDSYDVIVSEPTNPWIAGVASLFTAEYFGRCRERLKPGGVMSQWVQAYALSPADFASVVATFRSVFPGATLWQSVSGADYLLIGPRDELKTSLGLLAKSLSYLGVRDDLTDIEVRDEIDLAAHFVCGPATLARFAAGAPLQVDDRLALEFTGPRSLQQASADVLVDRLSRYHDPVTMLLGDLAPKTLVEIGLRRDRYRAYDLLRDGDMGRSMEILARVDQKCGEERISKGFMKGFYITAVNMVERGGNLPMARAILESIMKRFPGDLDYQAQLATLLCRQGEITSARALLADLVQKVPDSAAGHRGLAILAEARGDLEDALEHYRALRRRMPFDPMAAASIVRVLKTLKRHADAEDAMRLALRTDPALELVPCTIPLPDGNMLLVR